MRPQTPQETQRCENIEVVVIQNVKPMVLLGLLMDVIIIVNNHYHYIVDVWHLHAQHFYDDNKVFFSLSRNHVFLNLHSTIHNIQIYLLNMLFFLQYCLITLIQLA
jgi:hypothetical protein